MYSEANILESGKISIEWQGFIGKERDFESNLADHGAHKYDYLTDRFTSTGPLWEKYLGLTAYQYAGNNQKLQYI